MLTQDFYKSTYISWLKTIFQQMSTIVNNKKLKNHAFIHIFILNSLLNVHFISRVRQSSFAFSKYTTIPFFAVIYVYISKRKQIYHKVTLVFKKPNCHGCCSRKTVPTSTLQQKIITYKVQMQQLKALMNSALEMHPGRENHQKEFAF